MYRAALLLLISSTACNDEVDKADPLDTPDESEEPVGIAVLGAGSHSLDSVDLQVVAGPETGLDRPMDLGFNPRSTDQLWVVNQDSESVTIFWDVATDSMRSEDFNSFGSNHFLARPAAMAWSDFGNWASAQDTDDLTQGNETPRDFMGPTLWDDNMNRFDAGHGSHLDMLHNSPLGGGMAWEADNIYWLFDGYHDSITRYDFAEDHGYGGTDHRDGEVRRYVEGEVARTESIPSHLELDRESGLLYIADTVNNRIAVLDTRTGEEGDRIRPNYDGSDQRKMDGAEIWTLVDGPSQSDPALVAPAGLALHEGVIYVGDYETGLILAYDLDGVLIDWLDTGRGAAALGGIDFGPDGALTFTDVATHEILQIRPL